MPASNEKNEIRDETILNMQAEITKIQSAIVKMEAMYS
jgi:hypothetical protein